MHQAPETKSSLGGIPLGSNQENSVRQHTIRLDSTVTKLQTSKIKVIISGKSIETYHYEKPVITGMHPARMRAINTLRVRSEEYKFRSIYRAKNTIRRLGLGNFGKKDKFVTLTFNNDQDFDISDLSICLAHYKKFIRKLKTIHPQLKYITVPEFQKRGAVHYHVICNLPYVEASDLEMIWGHGYLKILAINDTKGVAIYLTKYLSKRFDDPRKNGHRLYYSSRNLKRSTIVYGDTALQLYEVLCKSSLVTVAHSNAYYSNYNGLVTYKQYNPKQNDH